MHDEVIKHTEKIYETAKSSTHSLMEKIRDIFIEIFIIVFAITLSIWFHNWSEHRHQQNEAKEFLVDVNGDLTKDLEALTDMKTSLSTILRSCTQFINFTPQQADTVKNISLNFSLNTFKANVGNYEGFKSSGKIGYIENKELKKSILEYYQEFLPALYDVDRYHYNKHLEVWESISSLGDRKMFSDPVLRAKITVDAQITEALIKVIDNAMTEATKIKTAIDKELK